MTQALLHLPAPPYRIVPVIFRDGDPPVPRAVILDPAGKIHDTGIDVTLVRDDVVVIVDLVLQHFLPRSASFAALADRGVRIVQCVHDILPIRMPACFPPNQFEQYLRSMAGSIREIICPSQATARDLKTFIDAAMPLAAGRLSIGIVPWGADFRRPAATRRDFREVDGFFDTTEPVLLMVGTIEPRKGHALVLDACEELWAEGAQFRLCVIGHRGWNVAPLLRRLRRHPEAGIRLLWLEAPPDDILAESYRRAQGLLCASSGEGFGLPLVEAAAHGLPILTSDLAVFRELCGPHATYFPPTGPEALAKALRTWLPALAEGTLPDSRRIRPLTWTESAQRLLAVLDCLDDDEQVRQERMAEFSVAACFVSAEEDGRR